jgi:hypothetical protein
VTESIDNTATKQRGRPWPKGVSGNPVGCRTGSRHKATVMLEQLMAGDAEDVVRAVIEKARGGDMTRHDRSQNHPRSARPSPQGTSRPARLTGRQGGRRTC